MAVLSGEGVWVPHMYDSYSRRKKDVFVIANAALYVAQLLTTEHM